MKTFAIAGCGHLGKIVHKAYINGLLKDYKLIAAYSLNEEDSQQVAEGTEASVAFSISARSFSGFGGLVRNVRAPR